MSSPFDAILQGMQQIPTIDPTDDISDPEQAKSALLHSMFPTQYQEPQRILDPIYETPDSKTAPVGSPWKEQSAPFPSEYKADVNQRKGIITAYLTVYNDPTTGLPFVDPYKDVIQPGAFTKTISDLDTGRKRRNNPHLCADLWQHERKEIIGSIKALSEDRLGIIYEAHLNMGVRRARECIELAAEKQIGSSFGYDPIRWEYKGDIRHLLEIRLHEVSQCSFPANDIAPILAVKSRFFVPSTYPSKQVSPVDRVAITTNLKTASSLFDQLTGHLIQAYEMYKWEAEMNKPRIRPGR